MTFEEVVDHYYERFRISDIETYLWHGYDINYQDPRPGPRLRQGWTLLHYAASHGRRAIVKYLATKGAELNIADSAGWTPLHWAVDLDFVVATQDGHMPTKLPTAEILLQFGADDTIRDNEGRTARDMLEHFGIGLVFDQAKERARRRRS